MANVKVKPIEMLEELEVEETSQSLPYEDFKLWYNAIINDDIEEVKRKLGSSTKWEQDRLLHGRFVFEMPNVKVKLICAKASMDNPCEAKLCNFQLPMTLSALSLSKKCILLFMEYKVHVTKLDYEDNNIMHALVWAAKCHKERENEFENIAKMILEKQPGETKRLLLYQENIQNVRPIELAGSIGCFGILHTILSTNGVYRFPQWKCGLFEYVLYDITDYEMQGANNNRYRKSPITALTRISRDDIGKESVHHLIFSPLILNWTNAIVRRNQYTLSFAYFLLFTYVAFYCLVGADMISSYDVTLREVIEQNSNGSVMIKDEYLINGQPTLDASCKLNTGVSVVSRTLNLGKTPQYLCLGYSILVILTNVILFAVDTTDRLKDKPYHNLVEQHQSGQKLIQNDKYARSSCVQAIFFVFVSFMSNYNITMDKSYAEIGVTIVCLMYALSLVMNIQALAYFLQLVPSIGYFVITFQNMVNELMKFGVMYILVSFAFNHGIFSLRTMEMSCIEGGDVGLTYLHNWYDVFLLSLNIQPKMNFIEGGVKNAYQFLHVFYVFILAIALVNFLIAVMTNTVSQITENKAAINFLNRLETHTTFDYTPVVVLLKKTIPKRMYSQYVHSDGRMYVKCLEPVKKSTQKDEQKQS